MQREEAGSQTRPEVGPPQSLSCVQPQRPSTRHWLPASSTPQFWVSLLVHSRQLWVVASQTIGAGQSASARHATQRPFVMSQCDSGAGQSLSDAHGPGAVHWPPPEVGAQVWPLGQPLRGDAPHPGWQSPPVPVQTRPESTAPQL